MEFTTGQFVGVAQSIADVVRHCGYTCYALAIMPDHLHLIIRKHRDHAETMIDNLQSQTRRAIIASGLRPSEHPVWTRGGWKVFLDSPQDVHRTIRYVQQNPVKRGWPVQSWPGIVEYDNWPFHKHR